jgi:hypothetical protein
MSSINVTGNHPLNDGATSGRTSTVGEPSVALAGSKAFVSGNWYASSSTDGASSWSHVDPFTTLPPVAGGFCCDQVVLHDQRRGIWIWILQYVQQGGANVFRIATSVDPNFPSGGWHYWQFAPTSFDGSWTQQWFDYPDAALGDDYLNLTFNVYDAAGRWQRALWMRFPLDQIATPGPLSYYWFVSGNGSLRLTQGAGSTMYCASHNNQQQIRLFRWIEGQGTIWWWDIGVGQWSNAIASIAPNNVNWLGRADGRITGATAGGGKICLMWTAGAKTGRPNAYCRVVRIDEATKGVIDEPDIWSTEEAWAYPATCMNSAGTIGFTAFSGGGARNPSHVVGARDDAAGVWRTVVSQAGTNSPAEPKWGDYLTCRADANGSWWIASGYTLQGGEARTDIVPRVVQFALQ